MRQLKGIDYFNNKAKTKSYKLGIWIHSRIADTEDLDYIFLKKLFLLTKLQHSL